MSSLSLTGLLRRTLVVCTVVSLLLSLVPGAALGVGATVGSDRPDETAAGGQVLGAYGAGSLFDLFDPDDDEQGEDEDEEDEDEDAEEEDEEKEEEDEEEKREEKDEVGGEDGEDRDGDDEDRDEEENEGEEEDEPAADRGRNGENSDERGENRAEGSAGPDGEASEDGSGVGNLVGAVLTEVVRTPDDGDRPGGGEDRTPRPDGSDSGGAGEADDSASGEASSSGSGSAVGPDGSDEADEGRASGEGGDVGDASSASQVETPTADPATETPSGTTETPSPARVRVEDVSTNRSVVTEGEPVRIVATVVNEGGQTGTRDVRLRLFGEVVDVRNVTVAGDEAREVSFVRQISAPGTYEAAVGNATTTVTVEAGTESRATTTDGGPASQETPGFTAVVALLGVLVAVWIARLRE